MNFPFNWRLQNALKIQDEVKFEKNAKHFPRFSCFAGSNFVSCFNGKNKVNYSYFCKRYFYFWVYFVHFEKIGRQVSGSQFLVFRPMFPALTAKKLFKNWILSTSGAFYHSLRLFWCLRGIEKFHLPVIMHTAQSVKAREPQNRLRLWGRFKTRMCKIFGKTSNHLLIKKVNYIRLIFLRFQFF